MDWTRFVRPRRAKAEGRQAVTKNYVNYAHLGKPTPFLSEAILFCYIYYKSEWWLETSILLHWYQDRLLMPTVVQVFLSKLHYYMNTQKFKIDYIKFVTIRNKTNNSYFSFSQIKLIESGRHRSLLVIRLFVAIPFPITSRAQNINE